MGMSIVSIGNSVVMKYYVSTKEIEKDIYD